jgi:hypothetical protein
MIIHKGRKMVEGSPQEIVSRMETDSLGTAFNQLTGAMDIHSQAQGILDAIGGRER